MTLGGRIADITGLPRIDADVDTRHEACRDFYVSHRGDIIFAWLMPAVVGAFRRIGLFLIIASAVGVATACDARPPEITDTVTVRERSMEPVRWDTVFAIGGAVEDTLLTRPRLIAAGGGALYAYDLYDGRVLAFGAEGDLRWTYGRHGAGPGEFVQPTDLAVDPRGRIWVADSGTGAQRSTVLTLDGQFERHESHGAYPSQRLVALYNRRLGVHLTGREHFWVARDAGGTVTNRGDYPTEALREANPAVRVPFVHNDRQGRRWAAVFPLGRSLLVYDESELRCAGEMIEGGGFPADPTQDFTASAVAVAFADTSVFVLARGETEHERRMIDEYSADDCRYLRTLHLPRTLQAMVWDDGTFYFYHEEPAPTLLALRPVFE